MRLGMSCCLPIVGPGTHGPTRVGRLPFLCLFSFILAFCLCAPAQEAPIPKDVLVLLYRPEPVWQRYRWQLELAIVFLLGLILLGVYLLVERARRRRAEAILTRQLSFETLISQISSELV